MNLTRPRITAVLLSVAMLTGVAVIEKAAATTTHGAPTVVAVVEVGGFNPYHFEFAGDKHPWNASGTTIDFSADPHTYLPDYPTGVPALAITLPTAASDDVSLARKTADASVWSGFTASTGTGTGVHMYRFPGTKIIGAVRFDGADFYADNLAHGTHSAATAVGNTLGTCPECLVVMVAGTSGLTWALQQDWIDVVTNSWTSGEIYSGVPPTKAAVDRGQSVVWSAGNGMLNANDVPNPTYASGQKGPDWVVTVGSTDTGRAIAGAGKPVDIAAEGFTYPSTGGTTAGDVSGSHGGTSNSSPMVAGALGTILQRARDLVGDTTGGQRSGAVVAQGTAVTCGSAYAGCPLGDGTLTRKEAEAVLFHNVRPTPTTTSASTGIPTTAVAYYYVGHGVVWGAESPANMATQQTRFNDVLRGQVAPMVRPAGEEGWMVADSRCRQRIWGTWSEGYYQGVEPPDAGGSQLATAWNTWCTQEVADELHSVINTVRV